MATPQVSIVIPTYDRANRLRACLDGIARLTFPRDRLEVVVVDDGGPESLTPVLAEFRSHLPIRLVTQENAGPGSARNAGATVAEGRFLAFLDDDCVPSPGWLSALTRELEAHPSRLLGGPVLNALPDNAFSSVTQLIYTFVAEHYSQGRGRERFFTTNNFALSADRFREFGGFDTSIPSATAEDKEFCARWRARGYEMVWVPGAVVHHAHELTLWRFVGQHYNYGRGIMSFRLKRRGQGVSQLVPERLSFYVKLMLHPLRIRGHPRAWRSVLLLVLSQLATAVGAAKARLADRVRRGSASGTRDG